MRRVGLATLAFACLGLSAAPAWRMATPGYAWEFPRDHRAHPDFKTEWWYFTGHLDGADGARFGYQFTLFRVGIDAAAPAAGSTWSASALVMGHCALTNLASGEHFFSETLWRAAGALGGFPAAPDPLIAWSKAPAGTPGRWTLRVDGDAFAVSMADATRRIAFDLVARPTKPIVLHGERGFSAKTRDATSASQYCSFTRMATSGRVTWDGVEHAVTGTSWMDQEFSSSQLGATQVGWDWFSLQLDDGRDVMLYVLRDADGRIDHASGTLVAADGSARTLTRADFTIESSEEFETAGDRAYPGRFRVAIASAALDLDVTFVTRRAENVSALVAKLAYFEGPVVVKDRAGRLVGRGYVELTGYGKDAKVPL